MAQVRARNRRLHPKGLAQRPPGRTLWPCSPSGMDAALTEIAELTSQLTRLSAQLQVLTAQTQPSEKASPWLPLSKAAPLLHWPPRTLRRRILAGQFPEACYRRLPGPSGKRSIYLVNVERYLKTLR